MAVSPKDGFLYGFDLADNKLLYRTPVTTIDNVDEPFSTDKDVHYCPGAGGGEEWNSPAYDPRTNLIFTGDVDWCTTVKLQTRQEIVASPLGQPWTGEKSINPFNEFGAFSRSDGHWAGRLHAVDADTGVWKWRLKTNYPILGAVTPTAGGLVFFFWRRRRKLLCDRRHHRREAVGSEPRRCDRRRRYHLYGEWRAEGRGGARLYIPGLSLSNQVRKGLDPRRRGRRREPMMASPAARQAARLGPKHRRLTRSDG
jgi:hypothetical protein